MQTDIMPIGSLHSARGEDRNILNKMFLSSKVINRILSVLFMGCGMIPSLIEFFNPVSCSPSFSQFVDTFPGQIIHLRPFFNLFHRSSTVWRMTLKGVVTSGPIYSKCDENRRKFPWNLHHKISYKVYSFSC